MATFGHEHGVALVQIGNTIRRTTAGTYTIIDSNAATWSRGRIKGLVSARSRRLSDRLRRK
jgi:hypothetical protein